MGINSRLASGRNLRIGSLAVFLAMGLVFVPVAASASGPPRTAAKTDLQRGLAFYKGQTVTMIAPDAPGATYDVISRILAPAMASYLGATVNVVNYPLSHTIPGQDFVAHAPGNGLTIGWMNTLSNVANQVLRTPFVNFNPEREAIIGATAATSTVWFLQPPSSTCPWTSWGSLIQQTSSSNPISTIDVGGSGDLYIRLSDYAFKINTRIVTGYSNSSGGLTGFIRGDACMDTAQPVAAAGILQSGKAIPIALTNQVSPQNALATTFTHTPTIAQLVKSYPPKTKVQREAAQAVSDISRLDGHIMFSASSTPAYKLDALRAAFYAAIRNPTVEHEILLGGGNIGRLSGPAAKQLYISAVKEVGKISAICSCLAGTTA